MKDVYLGVPRCSTVVCPIERLYELVPDPPSCGVLSHPAPISFRSTLSGHVPTCIRAGPLHNYCKSDDQSVVPDGSTTSINRSGVVTLVQES